MYCSLTVIPRPDSSTITAVHTTLPSSRASGGPAVRFLASVFPSLVSRWPRAAHASFVSCPESPSLCSGCRERLVRATSPTSRSCFYCTLGAGSVSQRPAAASDTPPSIYACYLALRWHPCMNFCLPQSLRRYFMTQRSSECIYLHLLLTVCTTSQLPERDELAYCQLRGEARAV